MYHPFPDDRAHAIERAKKYMSQEPLFLDTETTGLSNIEEVCEIAIIDAAGQVLINTLVKPTKRIPFSVTEIHGISDETVAGAPTMRDLLTELDKILRGREVLIYNKDFDMEKIAQSLRANGCGFAHGEAWYSIYPTDEQNPDGLPIYRSRWHCAMNLYAAYYGDWNEYHQSYRWQNLSTALRQCEIALPAPPPQVHRAHADAEMTRRLMLYLAEDKPVISTTFNLREG